MDIDEICEASGVERDVVQNTLAQLLRAKLIYHKQHVGFCRYAIRPTCIQFGTVAQELVFAVVPCK